MPSAAQWKKALQSSACDETLCRLYMTDDPLPQRVIGISAPGGRCRCTPHPGVQSWAATIPTTSTGGCWRLQ